MPNNIVSIKDKYLQLSWLKTIIIQQNLCIITHDCQLYEQAIHIVLLHFIGQVCHMFRKLNINRASCFAVDRDCYLHILRFFLCLYQYQSSDSKQEKPCMRVQCLLSAKK